MEMESLPFPIKPPMCPCHRVYSLEDSQQAALGFHAEQSGVFSLGFEAVRGKVPGPPPSPGTGAVE